ncbi:MAG: putative toxin-antitoxin system toxin component, PIN family [Chitinivibrionales bacterium]|nr:putative toxin-antitoxin system toxin component, PIN family [Chitinivibrionales bacterium]
MDVVVDTNVLVSGVFWGGKPGKVLEKWSDNAFELVATPPILDEYLRVPTELTARQPELAEEWTDLLLQHARIVDSTRRVRMCRDPDDDMYPGMRNLSKS